MGKDSKQEARLLKGLFKDSGELDQPQSTWRYALNALMNEQKGSVSNEKGTELAGFIPCEGCSTSSNRDNKQQYKVIGAIEVDFNRTVLFVVDTQPKVINLTDPTLNYYPRHSICIWDGVKGINAAVRILYMPITDPGNNNAYFPQDLNFTTENPIEGTYRIDSKEDVVVYWTDDLNPPRAFNISRQMRAKTPFGANRPAFWLYDIDPGTTHSKHITLLDLFPSCGPVPAISSTFQDLGMKSVGQGGGLRTGAYYLAVAYIDEDFVSTNYLTVSNPVSITPGYSFTRPTTKRDGAVPGTQTSKSITWAVSNINTDYKFLKCAIVRKMDDAVEVFKLSDRVITGSILDGSNKLDITFAGTEGFEPLDIKDVMIDTVSYDTAKTITQMDNVLYLGNLTGSPDLGYQKYANNIKVSAHRKPILGFDRVIMSQDNLYSGFANSAVDSTGNGAVSNVDDKLSYRDPDMITYKKGYRRGEIYAFYIAFILNDGSMSYAYHIPGREPIQPKTVWPELYAYTYGTSPTRSDYEYDPIPTNDANGVFNQSAYRGASDDQNSLHSGVKSFHFYDCSIYTNGSDANTKWTGGSRMMGYWHNLNEDYPDTRASEVWDRGTYENGVMLVGLVNGYYQGCATCNNGEPYSGNGLQGMKVRHHKMPSNSNFWARTIEPDEAGDSVESQLTVVTAGTFSGSFRTQTNSNGWWLSSTYGQTNSCLGRGVPFGSPNSINYTAPSAAGDPIPWSTSSDKFVANANNTIVTLNCDFRVYNDNNGCKRTHKVQVRYKETATSAPQTATSYQREVSKTSYAWSSFNAGPINLQLGGQIWINSAGDQGSSWLDGCRHKGPNCGSDERHIRYNTSTSGQGVVWNVSIGTGSTDLYDVNLTHDVHRLGISMDDINIPKTYADKIQGFRIYYAKRNYVNKTILGQSVVIPMIAGAGRIGICSEATANTLVNADVRDQSLSVASTTPEPWISKEAYSSEPSNYTAGIVANNLSPYNQWKLTGATNPVEPGYYKYLSFYDFNMMNNHHSLAGATHIELVYVANNWTWNGPTLEQEKKMLSEIITASTNPVVSDSGLYKIQERWGWDSNAANIGPQNCYAQDIKSAIFAGGRYITAQKWLGNLQVLTRLLSQKAKTYLNGDSILLAQPLGFSGKIINTYGDSTIALALKDKVELPALYASEDGLLATTAFSITNNATQCVYGIPPTVTSVLASLANPQLGDSTYYSMYNPTEQETQHDATSNLSYVTNLNAFKTDVFRSVDNQELVWTGFQVVGDDLDNFFFDNEYKTADFSNPISANYGNLTLNPNFGLQWRRDVVVLPASGAGVLIVISNNGAGGGAIATAVINTAGQITGVNVTAGGSGYTNGVTVRLKLFGKFVQWLVFTPTITANAVTSITVAYVTNTYKLETGECMTTCSDVAYDNNEELCVTGGCWNGLSPTVLVQDPDNLFGSGPTAITSAAQCTTTNGGLGSYVLFTGLLGGVSFEHGITPVEAASLGTVIASFPYQWAPGGNSYTSDCGGIYGGDTFIVRQGVLSGAAVLEENRDSSPKHSIHYHIVESEDNINYRHMENKDSSYYPESVASNVLQSVGSSIDPNTQGNIKYDQNFSADNTIRSAIPLPVKDTDRSTFPTRTIRSTVNDSSGIIDNYRIWLANQFKDLPKNRGQLWKLSTFNNLIYFHMEQSLFKAAGKQTMQMGDGTESFVGSGDIFAQEPTEIIQTKDGYGGTQSQYAALTTRFGYFFVDRKGKKVFMMKDTLLEISALGMENWFIDNMDYVLISYGATELDKVDNPIEGLGYHSVWDPYNKRIILTKRDLLPTEQFKVGFSMAPGGGGTPMPGKIRWNGSKKCFQIYYSIKSQTGGSVGWRCLRWSDLDYFNPSGWTISYYPDQAVWCSFHSYVPYIYFNTSETFYSITDKHYFWEGVINDPLYTTNQDFAITTGSTVGNKGIWKHNSGDYGWLYQDNHHNTLVPLQVRLDAYSYVTFELEVIQNSLRAVDTLTSSIGFLIDVINDRGVRVLEHGFTSFYVYNTFQISGDETSTVLEYLVNTRRIGNLWKVNAFRDLSLDVLRGPAGPQLDPYYMSTNTNLIGGINVGTQTTSHIATMFIKQGMSEFVNTAYLDFTKTSLTRRKFIDKWIGIRLIYDNITNNLLNLYSTSVEARKMYR